ncbi:hypothetical protein [Streptomyces cyaneus]|uniref:hypothetical protein n=1 Tax=Streptomyces cyaneus TaxID=1904 RepID=UPI0013E3134C|nr:hypothetical protein [Streptomyces cyaneus]
MLPNHRQTTPLCQDLIAELVDSNGKGCFPMKAYTKPTAKPVSQPDIVAVVR